MQFPNYVSCAVKSGISVYKYSGNGMYHCHKTNSTIRADFSGSNQLVVTDTTSPLDGSSLFETTEAAWKQANEGSLPLNEDYQPGGLQDGETFI